MPWPRESGLHTSYLSSRSSSVSSDAIPDIVDAIISTPAHQWSIDKTPCSQQPKTRPIPKLCFYHRPSKFSVNQNNTIPVSIRFSKHHTMSAHCPHSIVWNRCISHMIESCPSSNLTAFFSVPSPESQPQSGPHLSIAAAVSGIPLPPLGFQS